MSNENNIENNEEQNAGLKQYLQMRYLIIFLIIILIISFILLCKRNNFTYFSLYEISRLNIPRAGHSAVLLRNNEILITGGINASQEYILPCEKFNYVNKETKTIGNLNIPRSKHSSILLKDGNVLITGGETIDDSQRIQLSNAEIYSATDNKFIEISSMNFPKSNHQSLLLNNGNVFIFGESPQEIFDFQNNKFILAENLNKYADKVYNAFIFDENNILLIIKQKSNTFNNVILYSPNEDFIVKEFSAKNTSYKNYGSGIHSFYNNSLYKLFNIHENYIEIFDINKEKSITYQSQNNTPYCINNNSKLIQIGTDNILFTNSNIEKGNNGLFYHPISFFRTFFNKGTAPRLTVFNYKKLYYYTIKTKEKYTQYTTVKTDNNNIILIGGYLNKNRKKELNSYILLLTMKIEP